MKSGINFNLCLRLEVIYPARSPFNLAFAILYVKVGFIGFSVEAGEFNMIKAKKLTVLASLFLGGMILGGVSASALPLSNTAISGQSGIVTDNLVQKTGKTGNLLLGLGAGALIGGAIVNNNNNYRRRYRERPVRRYYRPRYEPWTDAWYNDCSRRYRSFNPETGYFRSYNRGYVFCR